MGSQWVENRCDGERFSAFPLAPPHRTFSECQYQRWKVLGDFSSLGFMPRAHGWALEVRELFKNYSTCYARQCQSVWGGIHSFIRCSRKSKTLNLLGISDTHGKSGLHSPRLPSHVGGQTGVSVLSVPLPGTAAVSALLFTDIPK